MKMKMFIKDQNGAAVVEFAIILSLLVLLLFGIIEFGLLFYNKQVITNASREGARAGIVGDCDNRLDNSAISTIVSIYCGDHLVTFGNATPLTNVGPTPRDCGTGVGFGDNLTVRVTYGYEFLVPSILGFGPTITIGAQTVMKMESE